MAAFGKMTVFVLVVAYLGFTTAELISETAIRTERVCEHSSLSLNCPVGQITIIYANYGRTDSSPCPGSNTNVVDCRASGSQANLEGGCNGRSSCSVTASNGVFGDPCRGTFKYLEVIYQCD